MISFFVWLCLFCSLNFSEIYAQDTDTKDTNAKWNDLKDKIVNSAKGTWDGASGFVKGMGQSFGYVGPGYRYSLVFYNDSKSPVFLGIQSITPVMGADFAGTLAKSALVEAGKNTGSNFYNQQLYISVWLCANVEIEKKAKEFSDASQGASGELTQQLVQKFLGGMTTTSKLKEYSILRKDIYPWPENDKNVYYYHAYNDKGDVKAEYLGIKMTTTEFIGTFYNSSDSDVTLKFMKNGLIFNVTLETDSFNLLQSDNEVDFSIRSSADSGRTFSFLTDKTPFATIDIGSQGIANVSYNQKTNAYELVGPMNYTYEVYKNKEALAVCTHGLSIGNFPQATSTRVRDINPVSCHFWYASVMQADAAKAKQDTEKKNTAQSSTDTIFFQDAYSLWATYKTRDFSLQQKIIPGKPVDFFLVRPQIQEKKAWLYAVLLNTVDEVRVKKFLDRLSSGAIKSTSQYSFATRLNINKKQNNFIDDSQGQDASGVSGYLVLADCFFPSGISDEHYYYYLEPSQLNMEQLTNLLYLDPQYYQKNIQGDIVLRDDIKKELFEKIIAWISAYPSNKDEIAKEIRQYIKQKGNKFLFSNPSASPDERVFNQQADNMVTLFINGPMSIQNYPILRQAATNYYVFGLGSRPDFWPS